jgi:dienelactone hydrolase
MVRRRLHREAPAINASSAPKVEVMDRAPVATAPGAGRERVLLAAGAFLTVLYVAAADLLVRPPGTSAASHLLGTLVTIGVIAGGAAAYPRLPRGGQAVLVLLLGLYAGLRGALALADLAGPGGAPGRDLGGLPVLVVGVAAFAYGVVMLWRSRDRGGSRARRYGRRVLRGVAAFAVALVLVLPVLLAVGFTNAPRASFHVADARFQDVTLETSDGLRLRAWYAPSRNGAAVIAFPGDWPLRHARMLLRHGYGVLLLARRGTGGSEGDGNPFGWGSAADLDAAVAWLRHRPDVRGGRIGGLGLSVGGELLLEEAARTPALRAVVSEGAGYRTLHEYLELHGAGDRLLVPTTAVMFGALRVLSPAAPPPPLDELVGRIAPRPILLIEAGHGQGGEQLNALYRRLARGPATLWRIPEADHTGGLEARPAEYERRVVGFFDRALGVSR